MAVPFLRLSLHPIELSARLDSTETGEVVTIKQYRSWETEVKHIARRMATLFHIHGLFYENLCLRRRETIMNAVGGRPSIYEISCESGCASYGLVIYTLSVREYGSQSCGSCGIE